MNEIQRQIQIVEPFTRAIEHTKFMLFKPFRIEKWFVVGFCAWLAFLGQSGGSGPNFNFNYNNSSCGPNCSQDIQTGMNEIRNFISTNLPWLVPVTVFALLFFIALILVITWLSSRGHFMFLHCVANNVSQVVYPWKEYRREANSLFKFRVVLGIALTLLMLAMAPLGFLYGMGIYNHTISTAAIVLGGIGFGIAATLLFVVLALLQKFLKDFIVPTMYVNRTTCIEAWKRFLTILKAEAGSFVLYILFSIVIALAVGMIIIAVMLFTCCCAACLFTIPYIGTVLLLPILVFQRSFSIFFYRQFGPRFDVFPVPNQTPTTAINPQEPQQQ